MSCLMFTLNFERGPVAYRIRDRSFLFGGESTARFLYSLPLSAERGGLEGEFVLIVSNTL